MCSLFLTSAIAWCLSALPWRARESSSLPCVTHSSSLYYTLFLLLRYTRFLAVVDEVISWLKGWSGHDFRGKSTSGSFVSLLVVKARSFTFLRLRFNVDVTTLERRRWQLCYYWLLLTQFFFWRRVELYLAPTPQNLRSGLFSFFWLWYFKNVYDRYIIVRKVLRCGASPARLPRVHLSADYCHLDRTHPIDMRSCTAYKNPQPHLCVEEILEFGKEMLYLCVL